MSTKTLILTVGLPRSGKSTWAQQHGAPMVNPDSIRLALHGRLFQPEAEPMVWAIARYMVKALFVSGHDTVILDATNVTRRRRNEWRSKDWECCFKVFDTDQQTCMDRAKADLVMVIMRMAKEWEPLTDDEKDRSL